MADNDLNEEEPTQQQATQLLVDPKRLGQASSRMSLEDQSDIICILVPLSIPAIEAAAFIHEAYPHLTLAADHHVPIRQREGGILNPAAIAPASCKLVLRHSHAVKDENCGFQFGRNKDRCDFAIGTTDASRRISNIHFRIYINEWRTLMLEDQSTNGTVVDGSKLHAKNKENAVVFTHTLNAGSVICLQAAPGGEDWEWTVVIPQRDDAGEDAYEENVDRLLERAKELKAQKVSPQVTGAGVARNGPLNLFPKTLAPEPALSLPTQRGRSKKEWTGGDKYNKVSFIGRGAFAVVWKVTDKFIGNPYAAKELDIRKFVKNGRLDAKVDAEVKIMQRLEHPNIVKYIEHETWFHSLIIVMELVPGGDLSTLLADVKGLREFQVRDVSGQLFSAVDYLHKAGITHRDIKPDNILILNRDENHINVKLSDFGLSKMINSEETFLRTFCGTLLYCAPEVYMEYPEYDDTGRRAYRGIDRKQLPLQRYNNAVDIWSLGCVLWFAFCGLPPYPVPVHYSHIEMLTHILSTPLDIRPLQRVGICDDAIRFLRKMLHPKPEYRATIDDMVMDPWYLNYGTRPAWGDNTGMVLPDHAFNPEPVDVPDDDLDSDVSRTARLEEEYSELSIVSPVTHRVNGHEESVVSNGEFDKIRDPEIPSSFASSENSSDDIGESFQFMAEVPRAANGRLFGEVNSSALRSSGAFPSTRLNLPIHIGEQTNLAYNFKHTSDLIPDDLVDLQLAVSVPSEMASSDMPPPPRPSADPVPMDNAEIEDSLTRPSSLLGAESMVGHLNMHSPTSATPPSIESPVATTEPQEYIKDMGISLRRAREEDGDEDDGPWPPASMSVKRQRRSSREIEMTVPASIFWDPKDKSSRHNNYPVMTTSEYHAWQLRAHQAGEVFEAGNKVFDNCMARFRSSRDNSFEVEGHPRAQSEPTNDEGRRMMSQQDEPSSSATISPLSKSMGAGALFANALRHTAADRMEAVQSRLSPTIIVHETPPSNDFQRPARIIAKFTSTPDSVLQGVNIKVTDPVTSWGRAKSCTIQYPRGTEVKIPKYAFKVVVFKPNYYTSMPLVDKHTWPADSQGFKLYISTKASQGIWINGVHLSSYQYGRTDTKSLYWVEVMHGDEITVWQNGTDTMDPTQGNNLKLECYWGMSQVPRNGQAVAIIEDANLIDELDEVCLTQESAILKRARVN